MPADDAPLYGPLLRVFLCGRRSFGAAVLGMLLDRPEVLVCGVSAPAPAGGAGEDNTWRLARLHDLPRLPAGRLRGELLPRGTDLIIAAHSHDFIGRRTRAAAALGAIGYHPSLLPLHRGRDAVQWTIRDRDRIAGGTVFWLTDSVDAGPIAAQDWCFVRPGDDASSLWARDLFPMGIRLLSGVIDDVLAGTARRAPQDRSLATWEPAMDSPPIHRPDLPELLPPSAGSSVSALTCKQVAEQVD